MRSWVQGGLFLMPETYDQQMKDSDMIFKQISSVADSFAEAEQMVIHLWVPEMSISRSGILHALERLERYFKEK